jgi:hypothetical protein
MLQYSRWDSRVENQWRFLMVVILCFFDMRLVCLFVVTEGLRGSVRGSGLLGDV